MVIDPDIALSSLRPGLQVRVALGSGLGGLKGGCEILYLADVTPALFRVVRNVPLTKRDAMCLYDEAVGPIYECGFWAGLRSSRAQKSL